MQIRGVQRDAQRLRPGSAAWLWPHRDKSSYKLVHRYELVGLVGDSEITRADHRSLRADAPEMHEVAAALESERAGLGSAMGAARGEASLHDCGIESRLGRAAGRRLVIDHLGADTETLTSEREEV